MRLRAACQARTLLVALCLTAIATATGATVRSDLRPSLTPALKAEIKRGYSSASTCFKKNAINSDALDACLGKAIRKHTHNPNVNYFMVGLEFGCWRLSDAAGGKYTDVYYFELKSYQRHVAVTDDQLLKATRTRDTKTRARLAYWAKYRPATPVELRGTPSRSRRADR